MPLYNPPGGGSPTGSAGGDLSGTYPNPGVAQVQGVAVTLTEAQLVSDLNNATTRSASATVLAGEETVFTGSTAGQTLTLPTTATTPTSSINTVTNTASVSVTLAPNASQTLNNFGATGNITIPVGYAYSVIFIGTTWYVVSAGPSDFANGNVLSVPNGGTGQKTAAAAYNALSPMSTLGDLEYESAANTAARLAGNTTTVRNFLRQVGNGTVSAAPAWDTLQSGDIPANGNVQTFTSTGSNTWTKPANATQVTVVLIGAGGGGGSGAVEASGTVASGGAGGGGGGYLVRSFPASLLNATETVTIGAGGSGGTAVGTTASNGNAGGAGGNTSFKSTMYAGAQGGPGGGGGTTGAATGGTGGTGFIPGGAGASSSATGGAGGTGSTSNAGGSGGGAGGGIATTPASVAGGAGGLVNSSIGNAGGTGGTSGGGTGGAGNGPGANIPVAGTGGGGGGSNSGGSGGAGGTGGNYGGPGGGGAGALTGNTSGAGGNGANGIAVVISTA